MHRNNIHKNKYDFEVLTQKFDALKPFVFTNAYQTETIDFSNPEAVKALNTAILFSDYNIRYWEFPNKNLCPPIPGRVDYIHHLNDVFRRSNIDNDCLILDIGTGATCIYPLLGHAIYKWNFVGTEISEDSLLTAQKILNNNELTKLIELRFQKDESKILKGIIKSSDKFEATMCNPPFFKTDEEALEATKTKLKGLGRQNDKVVRNFSGTAKELSYLGGEKAFLHTYLYESTFYKKQCFWFTSLVSNVNHVKSMQTSLNKLGATDIKVIEMTQGNKISRLVAWTFLSRTEQKEWNN